MCLTARFNKGKKDAENMWQRSTIKKITDLGEVASFDVLPLIDWYTSEAELIGEAGVSYLVKTGESAILFDVGLNRKQSDPSPLLQNMKQLGLTVGDFDTIFISHNHADHVGGRKWARKKSFSLTAQQIDLGMKKVYTPITMAYPGLNPIRASEPTVIAKGIATIGVIPNYDFLLGWIMEQALAINVKGKGIVLIVGCGHQTLPKILTRTSDLFAEPLYGIIGGLHYPVTDSRLKIGGFKLQRFAGTGKLPWKPITMDEVQGNITLLRSRNPKIVAISAHDSCDATIRAFGDAFHDGYRQIKVGERISL
jgi:7,8-dihydropterin-6-yl-methyl-4-(beta-D-ribofuranosyl)aminobenzene 5'-phosphate synthase